jgi:hypothetical protein
MRHAPLFHAALFAMLSVAGLAKADNYDSLVKPSTPETSTVSSANSSKSADPSPPSPEVDKPAKRRGGLVLGLNLGVGLAGSSGYPNDTNFIGNPDYYSASGLMHGSGGSGFIMGALADYLNFGFWFGAATFGNSQWHSSGGGGGLRLELFPLYSLGGAFRDLGAYTQVGIGSTSLVYKGAPGVISSGVGSFLAAGVFYEFWLVKALGGHFAGGPNLEYDSIFAEPIERHGAMLGLRFLWYGGK